MIKKENQSIIALLILLFNLIILQKNKKDRAHIYTPGHSPLK